MFIDWLQYTIKDVYTETGDIHLLISRVCGSLPYKIQDLLGYHSQEYPMQFYTKSKGVNFYQSAITFECGLKILYNPPKSNMGTNIIIPGTVLSQKPLDPDDVKDWIEKVLIHYEYNITRVDIAQDTGVDFEYFFRKYQAGEYVTRYLNHSLKSYINKENRGTIYFGSRGKGTMIRIYDKYLEQLEKLKSKIHKEELKDEFKDKSWTRIEMECRQEQAFQMLNYYVLEQCGDVFLGHLRFVEKLQVKKSRCKVDNTYLEIIKAKEERKLIKMKNEEFNINWFFTVLAPNMKAISEVHPSLYKIIMENIEASPTAKQKAFRSKREIERMYFSLECAINGVENNGIPDLVPAEIIDKVLKFDECI